MSVESKSNAAIFRLLPGLSVLPPSGSYRPTSRVDGLSSFGPRCDQVVLSFGFCDAGLKKLLTALPGSDQLARRG